jgi:integrase/recombinase XerD
MKLRIAKDAFMLGYFAQKKRARKTLTAYEADLQQFCEFAGPNNPVTVITKQIASRWLTHLRKQNYSAATRYRKMATLRVFCAYWAKRNEIPESPFWRINSLTFRNPAKQKPQTIPATDLRKLIEQAHRNIRTAEGLPNRKGSTHSLSDNSSSDTYRCYRDLAVIELLRATGIRIGEVPSLNVNHISIPNALLSVPIPKTSRPRRVPILYRSSLASLERYLTHRTPINVNINGLFLNSAGGRLSVQGVANILKRLCEQTGLKTITPTMFRNTVEQTLLNKGVDLRVVLAYLGKSSIAKNRKGRNLSPEQIFKELRKVQK